MNEDLKLLGKIILQSAWKNKRKALFVKPAEFKKAVDWYVDKKIKLPRNLSAVVSYVGAPLLLGSYLSIMSEEGPRSETYQVGPLKVTEHCRSKSTVFDNYGLEVLAAGYFPISSTLYYANKKSIYGEECSQFAELEKIVKYDIHIDGAFSHTVEDKISCYATSEYGKPITASNIRTNNATNRKFCEQEIEKYEQELAQRFER